MVPVIAALLLASAASEVRLAPADDLLIADFEGRDYGAWTVSGEAFGSAPAHGTLPQQMVVTGFEGRGLVNSYFHGDRATGILTSPVFLIERPFINFLLGGGKHPGETCMNLLVDGTVVRTATGPNDRPGGTERLEWTCWDVREFVGKRAQLQIVDSHTGGWGHINIDHIVQSSRNMGLYESQQTLVVEENWLTFLMPARQSDRTGVTVSADGAVVCSVSSLNKDRPLWVSLDVSKLRGRRVQVTIHELPLYDDTCLIHETLGQSNTPRGVAVTVNKLYHETYRPQFHFTAQKNWINDPNGLVFYAGEYHLFFQHNPEGISWGNMTWGHAVSPDMIHWTQLDHAIYPDHLGAIFSGSAVVDWHNTAGFQTGHEKVLVCIYTSAGEPFTQSIAYSNDRGRTWTKYEGNPVLGHVAGTNRDPKVIWHEPTHQWVMALYLDGNDYALFGSPNLKAWTKLCDVQVPGSSECPDLFELPVDGDPANTRWVFWAANGNYLLGHFDGRTFAVESGPHQSNWGGNCYAAQTWSDIPPEDGRRLQIAWMAGGEYPLMPFNQQMSFPCELTLRTTPEGIRLFRKPIRELATLREEGHVWVERALKPGENPLAGLQGELFEVQAEIAPAGATEVGFVLRGERVAYDAAAQTVTCLGHSAPLPLMNGRVKLHLLLDRTSLEVFGNNGQISMPTCFLPDPENLSLEVYAVGGEARIVSLEVYPLHSIWPDL